MASISGLTFSPDDYSEYVNVTFNGDGTVTASAYGPGSFSNADYAAATNQDPIEAMVVSVDTAASTPFGLGTVTVNDIDSTTGKVVQTYVGDVLGTNANGQVLLGIETADQNLSDPTDPYNGNYAFLSPTSISQASNSSGATFSTSVTYPGSYDLPCFAAGTLIATPHGEIPIETLKVGDLIRTVSGEARPLVWVGHRRIDIARHRRPDTVRPVRIAAGAFDDNRPARDLLVSPDHAIYIDDVLIPAKLLIDGQAVTVSDQNAVTYHHIELARHDVVFANGLPAETYLDTGNRHDFNERDDAIYSPFPEFSTAPDLAFFLWDVSGYAKLVLTGPELDAVRARLAHRRAATKRAA